MECPWDTCPGAAGEAAGAAGACSEGRDPWGEGVSLPLCPCSVTTAPEQLCYCANCTGLTRGALAWHNNRLLVTKRQKTFFSAQLRLKTLLLGLCWRPRASLRAGGTLPSTALMKIAGLSPGVAAKS